MQKALPTVTTEFLEMALGCNVANLKHLMKPDPKKLSEPRVKIDRRREGKIIIAAHNIPIMSPELERKVESTIAQYKHAKVWKEWGMSSLKDGGAVVLFEGPPGTGKTMIADYLAKKVGRGLVRMSMKDVGGAHPGDSERKVAETFSVAQHKGWATIFLDECDGLLIARDKVDKDSHYMVGVINELLVQLASYRGLMILATNRPSVLDPALQRRLLARIVIPRPEYAERLRLWAQKMPKQFPLKLSPYQLDTLASITLTGAEIENAIILEASNAMEAERLPEFATLQTAAQSQIPA